MKILHNATDYFGAFFTPPLHTGLRSGRYYCGPSGVTNTTTVLAANTIYYMPILIPERTTVVELGFIVSTVGTATLARTGLYRCAGGNLTAMAVPAEVSVSTTGNIAVTVSAPVDPGTYLIALLLNGTATITCEVMTGPGGTGGIYSSVSGLNSPTDVLGSNLGLTTSYPYAALPGASVAATTAVYGGNIIPHMWYRV